MNFDDKYTKLILRSVVAAYLIYLAYKIFVSKGSTNHVILLTIISIIFLIAAVVFIFFIIRQFIVSRKSQKD